MNNYERIEETRIEDMIFIIYYIIITLSLYANKLEREFLINNDNKKREEYRNILLVVFGIAFLVYIYYFINSVNSIKESTNFRERELNILCTIAGGLVLISGFIYLYVIYNDEDNQIEIAFN